MQKLMNQLQFMHLIQMISKVMHVNLFDASKSHDMDGDPCKKYVWDYGDGSPPETTSDPVTNHVYSEPGTYPVNCTVTDKYGKKGNANLTQTIKDPNEPDKIYPPVADVESHPHESVPKQPVIFDASKSQDFQGNPCKKFVWDFGDGSPKKTSTTPIVQHPYSDAGTYPVTVKVTDKYGHTMPAKCNQRVMGPEPYFNRDTAEKVDDPYVAVNSTPSNAKPKQMVTFDANKSHDMDKDPLKTFVWDFGDGTPEKTTNTPVTKHVYNKPGVYPVNVQVVDKFGQTGNASVQQRVSDPTVFNDNDPNRGPKAPKNKNYGGKKTRNPNSTQPVGNTFNNKGGNKKPGYNPEQKGDEQPIEEYKNEPGMEPDEIGDEFRNIVHEATSNAILDPNRKANVDGKKLADVMRQMNPAFPNELDPEAKRQYNKWKPRPQKPVGKYRKPLPSKPLPKAAEKRLHHVETTIHVDVGKPIMPDI
eukprot:122429_1